MYRGLKYFWSHSDSFFFKKRRWTFFLPALNPLSASPTKWPNTLKQFVGKLPKNCLSVFDYFVGLALKGLRNFYYPNTEILITAQKMKKSSMENFIFCVMDAKLGCFRYLSNGYRISDYGFLLPIFWIWHRRRKR